MTVKPSKVDDAQETPVTAGLLVPSTPPQTSHFGKTAHSTPPRKTSGRHFGTILSGNSPPPRAAAVSKSKSTAKRVKVRVSRSPRSSSFAAATCRRTAEHRFTVVFDAGRNIGLKLEHIDHSAAGGGSPSTSSAAAVGTCRVERFVDGGPDDPCPARQSGQIRPGDLVVAVNGLEQLSYESIIDLIEDTSVKREITFVTSSVWMKTTTTTTNNTTSHLSSLGGFSQQRRSYSTKRATTTTSLSTNETSSPLSKLSLLPSLSPCSKENQKNGNWPKPEDKASTNTATTMQEKKVCFPSSPSPSTDGDTNDDSFASSPQAPAPSHPDTALTPSNVKRLRANRLASSSNSSRRSLSSVLQIVYRSLLAPAAARKVCSVSLAAMGHSLSNQIGQVLVGHTSREFDATVQRKMILLNELSHAKISLGSKENMVAQLQEELEAARCEKQEVSTLLESVQSQMQQMQSENDKYRIALERRQEEEKQKECDLLDRIREKDEKIAELEQAQGYSIQDRTVDHAATNGNLLLLERKMRQLEQSNRDKEAELLAKEESLTKAWKDIDDLQMEKFSLTKDLCQQRNASSDANEEVSQLQSQLDLVRSDLAESRTSNRFLKEELQLRDTTSQVSEQRSQQRMEQMESKHLLTQAELERANQKISELSDELNQTKSDLNAASREIATMKREKDSFVHREAKIRSEAEEDAQTKMLGASALAQTELVQARSEIVDLQRQVSSLESSRAVLTLETDSVKATNEDLSRRVTQLCDAIEEKENQLSEKTMECLSQCNELEDVRGDLLQKTEELSMCQGALEKVKNQYSQLSDRLSHVVEESSNEKESMAVDLINLQDELAATRARNFDLENLTKSLRRSLFETEKQMANAREQLSDERAAIKSIKAAADKSKKMLEEKIKVLSGECEAHMEKADKLQAEHDQLQSDHADLQRKVHSVEEALSSSRSAVQKQEASLSEDNNVLREKLATERSKVLDLNERLRLSQTENEKTRRVKEEMERRHEEQLRLSRCDAELKLRKQSELLESKEKDLRDLHRAREELRTAHSEISRLEESMQRSTEEAEHLMLMLEKVREENAVKARELTKQHLAEVLRLRDEKEQAETALRKAQDKRDTVEKQLCEAEEAIMTARTEREQLLAEKNKISTDLHNANDALAELRAEIHTFEEESSLHGEDDMVSGEFEGLSKSELSAKCMFLQDELYEAEKRASAANSDLKRREIHIRRLEEDLGNMSSQIDQLVDTNELLDGRLNEIRSAKESSDAAAASSQTKADLYEKNSRSLKDLLNEEQSRNTSLKEEFQSLKVQMDHSKNEFQTREKQSANEIKNMKNSLSKVSQEKEQAQDDLNKMRNELSSMVQQKEEASRRVSFLQAELDSLNHKLTEALSDSDALKAEAADQLGRYSKQVSTLETESASLRMKVSELEAELEAQGVSLRGHEERAAMLSASLEKEREEALDNEKSREELSSKLAEATRAVSSQKESLTALELRASNAESSAEAMSEQVKRLQETIRKMESSSDTTSNLRLKQLQELEKKCAALDEERTAVRVEANTLRDELRQARRQAADYQKMNDRMQNRIDAMKASVAKTNEQLRAARITREESTSSSKNLEQELDNKQMEVNHLKANVQMLNATIARMRTEQNLLKEDVLKAQSRVTTADQNDGETSKLKSELQTKASKLESLNEVYKSQQEVLALSQRLEDKLLNLIEDVIKHADEAFCKISDRSADLEKLGSRVLKVNSIHALDLAGLEKPDTTVAEMRACLDDLSSIVPDALSALEDKRAQLEAWKQQRSVRVASNPHRSPDVKSRRTPSSPGVLDALDSMKRVINVLTPCKVRKMDPAKLDAEYLRKVVLSLEGQIDSLLDDLKSTNDALQNKDQLCDDLEKLVSHHESERDSLRKTLESRENLLREMQGRIEKEASWKAGAEKELAKLREGLDASKVDALKKSNKVAAGRLVAKLAEKRTASVKAAAFRQWSCQASVLRAVAQQSHAAAALTKQLDATREVVVQLKRHFKRNHHRSGSKGGGGQQQKKQSTPALREETAAVLDSILEGYETSSTSSASDGSGKS